MKFRVFQFCFWLILGLAVGLRFYQLGRIPVALYWDEAAILVDAKNVAQTGLDMHGRPWYQVIYPSYGDYKLPVYIWFASLAVKIFGVNEWALRLPSAIFGLFTVVVAGQIAKDLCLFVEEENQLKKKSISQVCQLLAMLILAVSPWSVMFSRTGFEGNIGQSLLAISMWLLLNSRKRPWLVIPASVIGSLATYAYFSVRFVWPVSALSFYSLIILWPELKSVFLKHSLKKQLVNAIIYLVVPLIIFWLLLIPMMKSPLYKDMNNFRLSTTSILNAYDYPIISNQLREQAGNKFVDRLIYHRYWLMIRELAINYSDNLSLNFMFMTGDPNLRHGTGQDGLFIFPLLLLLGWGLFTLFAKNKNVCLWLIIWWVIALLPASVPENTPHALRSLNALVPLVIIMAIGGADLTEKVRQQFSKYSLNVNSIFFAGYLCWASLATFSFIHFYFIHYPIDSADAWLDGYKQVALIADEQKNMVDEVYISGDDKLYLWLMAYGQYSAQTIQSWPSSGYQYSQFDNVQFKQFNFPDQTSLTKKYLIIGQYDQVKRNLDQSRLKPTWQQTINAADGKNKFLAVRLEP